MSIAPGSRLGPYEIVALLGAGGMGEVYRGRDAKLKREVALKVLPPDVAADHQRLARFQREAEMLASLNHPHIAQIYGIEETTGTTALVMELVEGEDLSQWIGRGAIPLGEALPIAKQITEALAAAHDAGIVHRDLKPANIKVRTDGTVKVLDFGLAKSLDANTLSGAQSSDHAPTLTSPAVSMGGVILGTAAYMAPEQARGKAVDKRADIWAFGCVFYEMVTGERLFRGDELTDVLASVLRDRPDFGKAPPSVRRLLQKCLEQEPRHRLRDLGDAWELVDDGAQGVSAPVPRMARLPWAVAALLALAAATLGIVAVRRTPAAAPVVQFQLSAPEEAGALDGLVSPDGRRILYSRGGAVWVRDISALTATRIPEADATVAYPIWSADSRSVVFSSAGVLRKADVAGGPAQTLCPLAGLLTGGFSVGDRIVFATFPGGLFVVPATGGIPSALPGPKLPARFTLHGGSSLLPDGNHFVYTLPNAAEENRGIWVASLSGDDPPKRLLPAVSPAAFVPSVAGKTAYLLFMRDGVLLAQPFSPATRELTAEPIRIVERVKGFSASATGAIVYRASDEGRRLTWLDRQGQTVSTVGAPDQYLELALSPDGSRAAVVRNPPSTWIFELAREASRRIPIEGPSIKPVWSADGKALIVASSRGTSLRLFRVASDGRSQPEQLLAEDGFNAPRDVSADGKWLLYTHANPQTTKEDLWLLSLLPGEQKPEAFLATEFAETDGMFSPNGRFVAYVSNESGPFEVYVRSFPASTGGKWRVSHGGGYQPRWRRDGKELLFFTADGRLMSAEVTTGATFKAGAPRTLFQVPIFGGGAALTNHYWDVSADGQRFLVNTVSPNAPSSMLTVVLNWQSMLPTGSR